MMIRMLVVAAIAVAGCDSKSDKASAAKAKATADDIHGDPANPSVADLSTLPLKPVHDIVGGVAFTILLPDGVKRGVEGDYVTLEIRRADEIGADPSVSITASLAAREIDVMEFSVNLGDDQPPRHLARKDVKPDSILVTSVRNDTEFIGVLRWVRNGDKVLTCSYSQRHRKGIKNFEAVRAWGEKICESVTFDAAPPHP